MPTLFFNYYALNLTYQNFTVDSFSVLERSQIQKKSCMVINKQHVMLIYCSDSVLTLDVMLDLIPHKLEPFLTGVSITAATRPTRTPFNEPPVTSQCTCLTCDPTRSNKARNLCLEHDRILHYTQHPFLEPSYSTTYYSAYIFFSNCKT